MKQRQAEFTSKEQSFFAVYQDSFLQGKEQKSRDLYEKLRVEIDGGQCHKMIQKIDNLLRELQDEKFIYTLQVR